MQDEWLSEDEIKSTDEVVTIDGDVQLDSLLSLTDLQLPHGSLDLDSVWLNGIGTVVGRDKRTIDKDCVNDDGLFCGAEASLGI